MTSVTNSISAVEAIKAQGNDAFQKGNISEALHIYQLAIQRISGINLKAAACDHQQHNTDYGIKFQIVMLKATLVSNQAMCLIKQFDLQEEEYIKEDVINSLIGIISDIDAAIQSMDNVGSCPADISSSATSRKAVRSKLLYRRSKVRFLLAVYRKDVPTHLKMSHSQWIEHVAKAQSDLQELLSFDPDNKEAITFLRQVKSKTAEMLKDENLLDSSPISSALMNLQEILGGSEASNMTLKNISDDNNVVVESLKYIHATLLDDISNGTRELLRNGAKGGKIVLEIACRGKDMVGIDAMTVGRRVQTLAMQCVASACVHPSFSAWLVEYLQETRKETDFENDLYRIVSEENTEDDTSTTDLVIATMALEMRLIIHKHFKEDDDCYNNDFSDNNNEIDERLNQDSLRTPTSQLQTRLCCAVLESNQKKCKLTAINALSVWLDQNPLNIINSTDENDDGIIYSKVKEPSEGEIRKMPPRQLAEYRKRVAIRNRYRKQRSRNNAIYFCTHGGLEKLISSAVHSKESFWRRECIVQIGRLVKSMCDETLPLDDDGLPVDNVLQKIVMTVFEQTPKIINIEEDHEFDEVQGNDLVLCMKRCLFATGVLYGTPSIGVWMLDKVWNCAKDEWNLLASSDTVAAMSIAAEFASAAANEKETRPWISSFVNVADIDGTWRKLLSCDDQDVQSGAASAMAKLGLSDKNLSSDEGELVALLHVATGLLQGHETDERANDVRSEVRFYSTETYNAPLERGVELLSYLASKTFVKNEIIQGAGLSTSSTTSEISVLEKLVQLAQSKSTISPSVKYSLATIFASLCVSVETLRREAFEGQEITPEQYDELQAMGKTQEERKIELMRDFDSSDSVGSRVKVMAQYKVPQALVSLIPGATEGTLEQVAKSFSRIACEESVRGSMIQQGCLSACINLSKSGEFSGTYKSIVRLAQHTIAKLLVTTNPSSLRTTQCIGSILPLLMLVKDYESSDLQKFEALLSITNLASFNESTKDHIVGENGISILSYAMFSNHEMVRRAATEAMSNLIPHPKIFEHLRNQDKLKVWVAFASDYENNFECARAALGCLAMATQDSIVANELAMINSTRSMVMNILECGRLELMHRMLVLLLNLQQHGESCKDLIDTSGAVLFCEGYVSSYQNEKYLDLGFSKNDTKLMEITINLAKEIISASKA
eukprot:CAMPEP_0176503760 /NCGR_PEP_ID=MMETSP0200_2-20121128/15547_1 /TAXON_ID=947934 /ORGANISM="Chaetoceros sp., Strain GSL56" /LENGTH=1176 /DNA_ID=CAMNT_0017903097 /DNA_START=57 /DNA_END=3587 /DNA_ORIENTATION=-